MNVIAFSNSSNPMNWVAPTLPCRYGEHGSAQGPPCGSGNTRPYAEYSESLVATGPACAAAGRTAHTSAAMAAMRSLKSELLDVVARKPPSRAVANEGSERPSRDGSADEVGDRQWAALPAPPERRQGHRR